MAQLPARAGAVTAGLSPALRLCSIVNIVLLARVAIPVPLGQAFTYLTPPELALRVQRGARVLVDFGRRRVMGVVLDVGDREPEISPERLKSVLAVVDSEPVLGEELLSFLQELARYYLAPIGEVMRLALPSVERAQKAQLDQQGLALGKANTIGRMVLVAEAMALPMEEKALRGQSPAIMAALREQGPTAVAELEQRWKGARGILKRLAEQGLVRLERQQKETDPFLLPIERDRPPELNPEQQAAVDQIVASLRGGERQSFLLHGVTASGKTEVYLHAAEQCLALGGSAILLVPEIALTPQLVSRFRARLGDAIAVLHSGLSDTERHQMWKRLRAAELNIAIGPRSALFAPVQNLKLLCVDEEHDGSFKQEEGVRYNARDMALLRAHRAGAISVLGSATPALESELLARTGKMIRLSLPHRARRAMLMPEVEIVDLRRTGPGPSGDRNLSLRLHRALEQVLRDRQQAILFLNRRGFAPCLICDACGHIAECPSCSVGLTLHRKLGDQLICHYCGFQRRMDVRCEKCQSDQLELEGAGTERIETLLNQSFPEARIARLDRDVAGGLKSEEVLARMRKGEVDILVGTQMVTKGHDLPSVTLVGVLNADSGLGMPDFRAAERTFQLLVQVAGRAGRGDTPGKVMIQTRNPEHTAIVLASRHDVPGFMAQELKDRAELGYPPFSRLALVRVDSQDEARGRAEADKLARLAKKAAPELQVLGPTAAPLARLRARYRFHFLLRSPTREPLRRALLALARVELDRQIKVALDVDPMSML